MYKLQSKEQVIKNAKKEQHQIHQVFFFKGRFYYKINKTQHKKTTIIYKIYTNPPPQRFQTLYIISKI